RGAGSEGTLEQPAGRERLVVGMGRQHQDPAPIRPLERRTPPRHRQLPRASKGENASAAARAQIRATRPSSPAAREEWKPAASVRGPSYGWPSSTPCAAPAEATSA